MIKKNLSLSLILCVLILACNPIISSALELRINGENFSSDLSPFTEGTVDMFPLRYISEKLNAKVVWNDNEKSVELFHKDKRAIVYIDEKNILIDEKNLELKAPAIIKKDRTFVPIEFFEEYFVEDFKWEKKEGILSVDYKGIKNGQYIFISDESRDKNVVKVKIVIPEEESPLYITIKAGEKLIYNSTDYKKQMTFSITKGTEKEYLILYFDDVLVDSIDI